MVHLFMSIDYLRAFIKIMCKNRSFKHNNIRRVSFKKGIKVLFFVDICRVAYYTLTNEPSAVRAALKKAKGDFLFFKGLSAREF